MRVSRSIAASALAAAVAAGGLAVATPAQAATTSCKTSSKSFNLPGKPDVKVSLKICIRYTGTSGGYRHYTAWLSKASWDGTSFYTGGYRFNDFYIKMRAEHGSTVRTNCTYGTCEVRSLRSELDTEKGSKTFSSGASGYSNVYVSTKTKKWTADATVTYDIADDGKGNKTWGLAGTKAIT
ncbi:hypothetical protein [Streptomyces minutiscleroticus]|uniref:Secreted protein n=1 Tax=Streptomyces minutiscleroticus TaxID=68238 RepID=A0A918NZ70_9ACTN|nr:hypothetical protein [Streptomyces minutiscleroticus]GGY07613.1 hypothetical protein GCM10010358_70950 [Streptomyces minutiscleroticus]